ncbi:carbohydrate ABC transporter membrane protein 1, CUT1 family [Thermoclostridium stercorarium subsp. stercorarium DSM 8532]|uniref:Carbohydrate ABC transporter membrane protein 1, CUT1 family n=1 Tax=Thermoclostridium stercorarium (strain ATCC 35414 / DSM 8532 / NCIMB 11754) TaxID=1121335 RepID=L7VQB5_THES1|nr:ABC transporter permease subunit [Thermoclostridium stercorarium]AGC68611.1 carbohydrate ABC transporter membrane protein 1, CUT1 family [Thermoclostridium stercorarium subsp. stercorarium DSM 8532]AGI39622.1 ABC transporter permease subunit [Thermoclostridium stercorarium subsp. stercorarium DSM 8532]
MDSVANKKFVKKCPGYFHQLVRDIVKNRWLYLMLVPGVIWFLIYRYLPMLGLYIAFCDFNVVKGIKGSEFVGLKYFKYIFFEHRNFWQLVENTLAINVLKLIFYFPAPIIFAIMLNEIMNVKYKRTLQTLIYLPHFVSWVVFGSIIITFLSPTDGIVNQVIKLMGKEPIFFMSEPKYFRWIVVASDIWKEAGWGTIIYLAAITNIDPQLYEAAKIDSANKLQLIRYITIPCISETIIVMLLLDIGRIMNVSFEQIYVLANPTVYSTGDVISTYVYRVGIGNGRFSLTTAIGLFQSVIGFILLLICNAISKRCFEKSLW